MSVSISSFRIAPRFHFYVSSRIFKCFFVFLCAASCQASCQTNLHNLWFRLPSARHLDMDSRQEARTRALLSLWNMRWLIAFHIHRLKRGPNSTILSTFETKGCHNVSAPCDPGLRVGTRWSGNGASFPGDRKPGTGSGRRRLARSTSRRSLHSGSGKSLPSPLMASRQASGGMPSTCDHCHARLEDDSEIYMYKDRAFCSRRCRADEIHQDSSDAVVARPGRVRSAAEPIVDFLNRLPTQGGKSF